MKIYFFKSHIYLFILFLTFFKVSAQNEMIIYDNFPTDQYSYLGGEKEFYKDFHKILIEKKLRPCENKKEFISIPVFKVPSSFEIGIILPSFSLDIITPAA